MSFKKLKCFIATAQHGSFSQAAKALYMTQSAVSQQVASLERQLEVELFVRNGRSVELTPSGKYLLEKSQPLLKELEAALGQVVSFGNAVENRLTILSRGVLDISLVSPLLSRIKEQNSSVLFELQRASREKNRFALIQNHEIDLLFGTHPMDIPDDIGFVPMARTAMYCIVPMGHEFAAREMVVMEDLLDTDVVLLSSLDDYAIITQPHSAQRGQALHDEIAMLHKDKSRIVKTIDGQSLQGLVASGFGASVLDSFSLTEAKGVACVPFDSEASNEFGFCYSLKSDNPLVAEAIRIAQELYSELPVLGPNGVLLKQEKA